MELAVFDPATGTTTAMVFDPHVAEAMRFVALACVVALGRLLWDRATQRRQGRDKR